MDDVRRLKQREFDGSGGHPPGSYAGLFGMNSYYGAGSLARGSVRLTNFFELAFENMQSSMSQKMLRKSLTNGARKILDSANREVAEICKVGLRSSSRDGAARRGRGGYRGRGGGGGPGRHGKKSKKKKARRDSAELVEVKEAPDQEIKKEEPEEKKAADEGKKESEEKKDAEIVDDKKPEEKKKSDEEVEKKGEDKKSMKDDSSDSNSKSGEDEDMEHDLAESDEDEQARYELDYFEKYGLEVEDDDSGAEEVDSLMEEEAELERQTRFGSFKESMA